jgi:hypothetical protein
MVCVIVDPFNDSKVMFTGRSGSWQTRNGGTSFFPAMDGQAGTMVQSLHQTGARSVVAGVADWAVLQTSDDWHTASRGSTVPAGSGVSLTRTAGASTSFTGDDGASYVFTQATASVPAKLTKNGVKISDPESEASLISANHACASSNGVVTIGSNGGGVYVFEPSSGPGTAPTITGFTPTTQAVGSTVVVTGTNLTGATQVSVNGVVCTSYTVNSATQITLTVPTGATSGPIGVVTPNGSTTSTSTLTVSGGGGGTAPTITSFTPGSGIAGDTITVTGTNLATATAVTVNGTAASFTAVSSTTLTLIIPTGATTGPIRITTPAGSVTSGSNLTVTTPSAPTITSFTPTSGAIGSTVTITGTNFIGATAVKVNGISAGFVVVNSTTITFPIPNSATSGHVSVTTPGGTVVSSGTLTVTGSGGGDDPLVRVLDKQAPAGGSTTLTLTIPSGGVPIGHTVIVLAGCNHVAVTGVTDTRGNTYTIDTSGIGSSATAGSIIRAPVTTALLAGDTITITYASSIFGRSAIALEYQYILTVSPNDAPVSANTSNSATTNTNVTITGSAATVQTNEVAVSGLFLGGSGASAGAISIASPWTLEGSVETASGTIRAVAAASQTLSATGTPSAAWSWAAGDAYTALLATYKFTRPAGGGGGTGAAPVARQTTPLFPATLQQASQLALPAWANPTLGGSRIVVEVAIANNQNDGIGVTIPGYTQTTQSPAVRQTNPTGAGAHDQLSIRQFQKLNCNASEPAPTVRFTGLPGAGVYVWASAHEVTGSHPTLLEDTAPATKATGSSATPTITAPGPSSRDTILYLASIATGNSDVPTPDAATTFVSLASGSSGGAAATAKLGGIVLDQPQTLAGTAASAIVDVTQSRTMRRSSSPSRRPTRRPGPAVACSASPTTNDGVIHRHTALQYWGGGIAATQGGNTALQNAQLLASQSDIVVANVKETDSAAGTISLDRFRGLAGAMRLVKPNILLAPYAKSAQIDEGATYFPNTFLRARRAMADRREDRDRLLTEHPDRPTNRAGQPQFTSPRGFTVHSFAEYRAKDAQHTLATYNTINGAGTLNGWYQDSAGPSTYKNQADPLNPTQTYPTRDSWLLGQVYPLIDGTVTTLGPGSLVIANGLISGPAYYSGLSRLLEHAHIGVAESWLRGNFTRSPTGRGRARRIGRRLSTWSSTRTPSSSAASA